MSDPDTGAVASYLIKLERDARAARDEEIAAWCLAHADGNTQWAMFYRSLAADLRQGRVGATE